MQISFSIIGLSAIKFKFIEAAEYLGTIQKYGTVDETDGVSIDQMVQRSQTIEKAGSSVTSDINGDSSNMNIKLVSLKVNAVTVVLMRMLLTKLR